MYVFRSMITGFLVGTDSRVELCLEARPPTRFPLRFRTLLSEEAFAVLLGELLDSGLDSTVFKAGFVGVAVFEEFSLELEFGLGKEIVVDFSVVEGFFLLGVDVDDVTGDDDEAGVTVEGDVFGFALVLLEEGTVGDDDDDDD